MASFFLNGREIKGVAFDMDGTLIDCEPTNRIAVQNAAGQKFKIDWKKYTGVKEADILAGLKKQYGEDKLPIATNDFVAACKRGYEESLSLLKPRPGMIEILNTFKELGIPVMVVTNSDTVMARKKLEQCGMLDYMYDIIGSDTIAELGLKAKPAPDGYIKAAEMMGIQQSEMMGWEDSMVGLGALQQTDAMDVHIGDHGTEPASSADFMIDGRYGGMTDMLALNNLIRRENYKQLLGIKEEKAPATVAAPATPELV